ncbi:MAG: anaerobic ribonucleoside-triphosphate reductase activating protein [Desulfovibrionaceae bacterium]|nr:anaerobic ribonucleoside-triphosphate reductase activating protein [Desulfovibrionaceae bacterium]
MKIGGLQKTTMLDFPGKVSAVVFTQGCNFLCPYCHNPGLIFYGQGRLALADLIAFLTQRRNVLEGVVISGGEPTQQEGLPGFCATLKSLGYAVKLDTNGSRPEVLHALLAANLLSYVAMDVKGNPWSYPKTPAFNIGDAAAGSMRLLRESGIAHEFRIPCVSPFIDEESFAAIMVEAGNAPLFLQAIRLENVLQPNFFAEHGRVLTRGEMECLCDMAKQHNVDCRIR